MIDTLKEIIVDQQSRREEAGIERRLTWEIVQRKAFICVGVRRCGKSTLLRQIRNHLFRSKHIAPDSVFHLDFFDDRFQLLRKTGWAPLLEAVLSLDADSQPRRLRFFFDEIQEIPGWEPFVQRLLGDGHDIFITGSSAKMLSKEIASQMRGRSLSWELFPFSFREFLDYRKINPVRATTARIAKIRNAFADYGNSGGFPEVLPLSPTLRIKIHQEYLHTMLYRDVIERHDLAHPRAVLDLAYRLLSQSGSLYSINRLTEYLKALGHKTDKGFVSSCLDWFEDCYFLFSVKMHDRSVARQNVNSKKIYCVDHALVTSVSPLWQKNAGAQLETMVFVFLRSKNLKLHYYKTKSGKEVDFFCQDDNGRKCLLQVCHQWNDAKTWEREINSLQEAKDELGMKSGFIITNDTPTGPPGSRAKGVNIVPAWRFFLDEKFTKEFLR